MLRKKPPDQTSYAFFPSQTFNSPSESPPFLDNLGLLLHPFFTQSLNHFHLSRQVSRTESRRSILWSVKHFHAKENEEKRERKCKSLRCFVLRTFFFLSFAKSRSCFVSKLFEKWEIFRVWFHFDGWKSSTRNPMRVLCFRRGWKQTHYFISARAKNAIKSNFMFATKILSLFIVQQIKKIRELSQDFKSYLFR